MTANEVLTFDGACDIQTFFVSCFTSIDVTNNRCYVCIEEQSYLVTEKQGQRLLTTPNMYKVLLGA